MTLKNHHKSDVSNGRIPSKDLPPLPDNFAPVFFRNQFLTTIPLPTETQYPDLAAKCFIITGANSGLGFEAARQLLSLGLGRLIIGVRSVRRGQEAATQLRVASRNSKATIDVWELDMESYVSIRGFAKRCQGDTGGRIDAVILNAGLSALNFSKAEESTHEVDVQVNHYGTSLLAALLVPILKVKAQAAVGGTGASPKSPVITIVNSVMAHLCKLPNLHDQHFLASFDDPVRVPFDGEERYGASKLLSQMFLTRLADLAPPDNGSPIINMVDPGLTKGTRLAREVDSVFLKLVVSIFLGIAGRPVGRGSATYLDATLNHGIESHGCFLMNCQVAPLSRWYYKESGLIDKVWEETLQDPGFSGVRDMLQSSR